MCAHGNAPLQIYKLYTFTLGGWANKDTEKIDDVNYVKKKKTTHQKLFTKYFVISQKYSLSSSIPQVKKKSARTAFLNLQVKLLKSETLN